MNKKLICIVFFFLSGNLLAQQPNSNIKKIYTGVSTTLFEYGEPVKSSEANFRNLFKNFPLLITNAGEGLKLISYKYITEIKDQKQTQEYLEKNTKLYMSDGVIAMSIGGTDGFKNSKIWLDFPSEPRVSNKISEHELKQNLEKIAGKINLGDEVYVLNFIANGIAYEFYMFVNPNTKVMLKEGNFFGFDIPLNYADFYSKKQSG